MDKRLQKALKEQGIYERYQENDLDILLSSYKNEEITEKVVGYCNNIKSMIKEGIGILFLGGVGCGKTSIAIEILKYAFIQHSIKVTCTNLKRATDFYMSGWKDQEKSKIYESKIKNVPLLCVDDIGKDVIQYNNMVVSVAFDIINYRNSRKKPTLLTTNFNKAELIKNYGQSFVDRLEETCLPINFGDTPSFRPLKGLEIRKKFNNIGSKCETKKKEDYIGL